MTDKAEPEYLHEQTKLRTNRYGRAKLAAPRPVRDRMGLEIKEGDLIAYVLHHFNITGAAIFVGTVTKIAKNRDVYAKNISLVSKEKSEEKKIKDHTSILKLQDDTIQNILLKKLTLTTE